MLSGSSGRWKTHYKFDFDHVQGQLKNVLDWHEKETFLFSSLFFYQMKECTLILVKNRGLNEQATADGEFQSFFILFSILFQKLD